MSKQSNKGKNSTAAQTGDEAVKAAGQGRAPEGAQSGDESAQAATPAVTGTSSATPTPAPTAEQLEQEALEAAAKAEQEQREADEAAAKAREAEQAAADAKAAEEAAKKDAEQPKTELELYEEELARQAALKEAEGSKKRPIPETAFGEVERDHTKQVRKQRKPSTEPPAEKRCKGLHAMFPNTEEHFPIVDEETGALGDYSREYLKGRDVVVKGEPPKTPVRKQPQRILKLDLKK